MSKFLRKFQLTVSTRDGEQILIGTPLTCSFNVIRHNLSAASNANIKIFNLSLPTRDRIYKNSFTDPEVYLSVELRAGYENIMPVIFRGNILEARSYRQEGSTDFITEIDAYDGGFDLAHGDSNFSVAAGTTREDAILRLCQDMPHCKIGAIGSFPGTYSRQRVFSGKTRQLLADETGGNYFIDNEHIYCLKDSEAIEGEILLVSSETGLLGSPTRNELFVLAEMIFEPRIKIGQAIELVSTDYPSLNQVYKVIGVQHAGTISDAVGGKLKTTIRMLYGQQDLTIVGSEQYA